MSLANCILLVDDSAVVRRSLRRVFEQAGWGVCGEADSGSDAIVQAQQLHPQVTVLDLAMPGINGLAAAKILKGLLPETHLILFTLHGSLLPHDQLPQSGISAVVSKSHPVKMLLNTAERLVMQGAA